MVTRKKVVSSVYVFWQIKFSSECEGGVGGGGQANQKQFNPTMELKLHQPCLNATNFSFKIIIKAS